jgi:pimeloyl-ACP methyl ester carboxylesterase
VPLLILGLVAAGCTGTRDITTGTADWQPCPEVPKQVVGHLVPPAFVDQLTADMTYECATIHVPRLWSDPDGGTFDVALLRARADDQRDRIGSLLVNPGGPGGSGVDLAVFLSFGAMFGGLPPELTRRFDIVGFDPRGVARSSPVECFSDADLEESFGADPDPATAREIDRMLADSQRMAEICGAKYGADLGRYSTHQTARDMDAIRRAVGDERVTYLGFSYGSLLGAVYARLFPDRIRAMVLDGAVDPGQDRVSRSQGQAEGFEQALDNFATWCAQAAAGECPLGEEARAAVVAALDGARRSPAVGDDGRQASTGWVFYAVLSSLYSQQSWPVLAAAIDQLAGGDPTGVFDLADAYLTRTPDGAYSNQWDANTAISCADGGAPELSVAQVRELQAEWRAQYPLFGGPAALGALGCAHWPAEPDPYPTGAATGAPPILVVGTTGDPATPYESTRRLADLLGVGVVLTFQGEGHTAYPGDACVSETVNAYLLDLTVPDDGTTCPAG